MKIKETITKEYICDFCGLNTSTQKFMEKHEKECEFNPEYIKFVTSETKKIKKKLIDLVYNSFKDDKDLMLLLSIKDGDYSVDIQFMVYHKITSLITKLCTKFNIHIPSRSRSTTIEQIEKAVIKKLGVI